MGTPGGLSTLDAGGKLTASQVPANLAALSADGKLNPMQARHGLVGIYQSCSDGALPVSANMPGPPVSRLIPTNAPWASFAGVILDGHKLPPFQPGDRLTIYAHFGAHLMGAGSAAIRLAVNDGMKHRGLPGCEAMVHGSAPWPQHAWTRCWTAESSRVTITLEGRFPTPGPTLFILAPWSIAMRHERV